MWLGKKSIQDKIMIANPPKKYRRQILKMQTSVKPIVANQGDEAHTICRQPKRYKCSLVQNQKWESQKQSLQCFSAWSMAMA